MKKIIFMVLALTLATVTGRADGPIVPWPLNREVISANELTGSWLAKGIKSSLCVGVTSPNPRSDQSRLFISMLDSSNLRLIAWASPMNRTFTGVARDYSSREFGFSFFKVNRVIYLRLQLPLSKTNVDFRLEKKNNCSVR